jgi:hypothetical protein
MIMAAEKLPSLCGMIPAIEMFMSGWEALCDKQPDLRRFIQPGLKFAVKYYRAIDKTSSYAIAMCKSYLRVALTQVSYVVASSEPLYSAVMDG